MISELTHRFSPHALMVLRIMAGFMFWQHGIQKFGFLEGTAMQFPGLLWFAAVLEVSGGSLIVLGLFTRPVALVLLGEMAVAYSIAHVPAGFWPILNGGEPAFLFFAIYLTLLTSGPGRASVDGCVEKRFGSRWWM